MEFETEYKENNIWKYIGRIAAFILVITLGLLVCYIDVAPARKGFVVELGEKISTDLSDYLVGMEWAVEFSELDLTAVNEEKTGTYTAIVKHGWQTFYYEVIIQDTIAPKISILDKTFFVQQEKEYNPEHFIMSVKDASDIITLTVSKYGEAKRSDTICFEKLGDDKITIMATDINGNSSEVSVRICVDTPPVFDGIKECYVALGTEPDFINEIYAYDEKNGDVTGNIVVDETQLNCDKVGDYDITYYVEDYFGLSTESVCKVHVLEDDEIKKCISNGQINRDDSHVLGITGIDYYVEKGVVERQIENVVPMLVNIRINYDSKVATGGGCILDITNEYVYIGSNRHVLDYNGDMYVYFFDGTKAPYEVVVMDDKTDMGIIRVSISDIQGDTIGQLKCVKINENAWERISTEEVPLFFCLMGKDGMEYSRVGLDMGYSMNYKKVSVPVLQVSMRLEPGNSGSAIFDYEGNLIALATGQKVNPGKYVHYYAVGAKNLVRLYEQIIK